MRLTRTPLYRISKKGLKRANYANDDGNQPTQANAATERAGFGNGAYQRERGELRGLPRIFTKTKIIFTANFCIFLRKSRNPLKHFA